MNATERARALSERRTAIQGARTTTIHTMWQMWATDMLFDDLPPRLVDKLRVAFYEGAWRVAENVATVASDVRQRILTDMAETLLAEAWAFDETAEARRAFAQDNGGTS